MRSFPAPIPLRKLIGPSFVILALGLGSGEVILWPYLSSNYGLGIIWGAMMGITFQYFINMEIERYALVKGESVFVGFARFWKLAPLWFILSTFAGFGLPGIISASAKVFSSIVGLNDYRIVAVILLLCIGLILSAGKTVYGLMETLTKTIILICVPCVFLLAVVLSTQTDWIALMHGVVGNGDGYRFLPEGIALATFLGAFAYAGAGGNLNLTQSIYIKEKGYGMGKYAQKIAGLFTHRGAEQRVTLEGETFPMSAKAQQHFSLWWRRISLEHALVFWFIGAISIALLALLAYTTTFGTEYNSEGINFVLTEGRVIGERLGAFIGTGFLLVVAIMLFQTQLGVLDSTSRIMAENAAIMKIHRTNRATVRLSKMYFTFLWAQIAFGILVILTGNSEPKALIVTGACINALAMFVHIGLVAFLNAKTLPKPFQASLPRKALLGIIFVFFGVFTTVVFMQYLQ